MTRADLESLDSAIRTCGGHPSQAIPWGPDGWACPGKRGKTIVARLGEPPEQFPKGKLKHPAGRPFSPADFPQSRPKEDFGIEIKLAGNPNGCITHNAAPFLAWYKQACRRLDGLLLPAERAKDEEEARSLEGKLNRMLGENRT